MFETVLFDIDGVMLSEERYFDASALTVYELLYSPQYLGLPTFDQPAFRPDPGEPEIRAIRCAVFADDRVLRSMKDRGVNANWDMVYLQFAYQLTQLVRAWAALDPDGVRQLQTWCRDGWTREALQHAGLRIRTVEVPWRADFSAFVSDLDACTTKDDLFDELERRLQKAAGMELPPLATGRALWTLGQEAFQEWYLGDAYVPNTRQPGKRGFLTDEVPIVDPAAFTGLLERLTSRGVRIGIATGRPEVETRVPLEALGWLGYFEDLRVTTATDVLTAERLFPDRAPLGKPHPFSYLRSYLASDDIEAVLSHPLPLPPEEAERVLIVGDSVADRLAARSMGCRFAAVLTGLEGEAARAQFEALDSDYVFENVLALSELFR